MKLLEDIVKKTSFLFVVLLGVVFLGTVLTGCSSPSNSGSGGGGSSEEEVLDGDYNGTVTLGNETYWVSFFAGQPLSSPGYYADYSLHIYNSKSKTHEVAMRYSTGLYIDNTKIEHSDYLPRYAWCLTSTDGKTYSGEYTDPMDETKYNVRVTKKE